MSLQWGAQVTLRGEGHKYERDWGFTIWNGLFLGGRDVFSFICFFLSCFTCRVLALFIFLNFDDICDREGGVVGVAGHFVSFWLGIYSLTHIHRISLPILCPLLLRSLALASAFTAHYHYMPRCFPFSFLCPLFCFYRLLPPLPQPGHITSHHAATYLSSEELMRLP